MKRGKDAAWLSGKPYSAEPSICLKAMLGEGALVSPRATIASTIFAAKVRSVPTRRKVAIGAAQPVGLGGALKRGGTIGRSSSPAPGTAARQRFLAEHLPSFVSPARARARARDRTTRSPALAAAQGRGDHVALGSARVRHDRHLDGRGRRPRRFQAGQHHICARLSIWKTRPACRGARIMAFVTRGSSAGDGSASVRPLAVNCASSRSKPAAQATTHALRQEIILRMPKRLEVVLVPSTGGAALPSPRWGDGWSLVEAASG